MSVLERLIETRRLDTASRMRRAEDENVSLRDRMLDLESQLEVMRTKERKVRRRMRGRSGCDRKLDAACTRCWKTFVVSMSPSAAFETALFPLRALCAAR